MSATGLGAVAVRGTMFMSDLGPNDIDEVIMGWSLEFENRKRKCSVFAVF